MLALDRSSEHADDDARLVAAAITRLRVSEFQLFHMAYRAWFGRTASDEELEPAFVRYLLNREIPPWVRHLARKVTGRLAPAGETGHDEQFLPAKVERAALALGVLLLALALALA